MICNERDVNRKYRFNQLISMELSVTIQQRIGIS